MWKSNPWFPRRCAKSRSHELNELDTVTTCPKCGGLLSLENDAPAVRSGALRATFDQRLTPIAAKGVGDIVRSGVWRFRELVLPSIADQDIVTQWEGNTPLLRRARVADWAGISKLWLKHEGHNPTGS